MYKYTYKFLYYILSRILLSYGCTYNPFYIYCSPSLLLEEDTLQREVALYMSVPHSEYPTV